MLSRMRTLYDVKKRALMPTDTLDGRFTNKGVQCKKEGFDADRYP
jgi:hypothetical protein